MKKFNNNSLIAIFTASLALAMVGPIAVFAATSPVLVGSSSYSVVAGSIVTNTGPTSISGNVGISPSIGVPPHYHESGTTTYGGVSSLHDADGPGVGTAFAAQADNLIAFGALDAVPNVACTTDYGAVTQELSTLTLTPGIYCADAFNLNGAGPLTLNALGDPNAVWIFRSVLGTLITTSGVSARVVFLSGVGSACNVWWKVASSATIGVGTTFIGNILALTSITLQTNATLDGRAMAQTGAVTMDTNTISGPTCAVQGGGGGSHVGNINVVKTVINDNGGTKVVADFPLFVDGTRVVSGVTNVFPANGPYYTITETKDPNYVQTFSGDCDYLGHMNLSPGDNRFCIITNNDIGAPIVVPPVPPLIDVVKVPSPLALPAGPGPVTYTYTVRNIGTVPMTDITMVGDSCSPITRISGDTNSDSKLDVTETWVYTCSTTLPATHTNTVVATGWANGLSATDIASATVVVGLPPKVIPPLIHVTKVPNPLALLAGGGMVTYTERITNPGTVPLNNVKLTDDKCSPMVYISGDTNTDLKLDKTETWTYTCKTNLTATTTNTATATGEANGITVRDFALATVVVANAPAKAVPTLPNTGFPPAGSNFDWSVVIAASVSAALLLLVILKKQTK